MDKQTRKAFKRWQAALANVQRLSKAKHESYLSDEATGRELSRAEQEELQAANVFRRIVAGYTTEAANG